MGVLSKGTDFTNGDQVTDTSLDNLVDNATFTTSAVDEVSTDIGGSGSIIVKDGGGFTATLIDGTPIASHQAFWFAWSQFHPETLVYTDS